MRFSNLLQYNHMKSLSPPTPLVLVMVGKPGAGKTFFARQFSDTFRAPVVSYERIRYELFTHPTFSQEEQTIVERLATYQVEELLKTNRSFIIDGGGNARKNRQNITGLAKPAGYNTLAVWVQTDDATAHARATKRNKRRIDDTLAPSISSDQFRSSAKLLTEPSREAHVVISGKHNYSTQARAVLKKLVESHQTATEEAHQIAKVETATERPSQSIKNIFIR